MSTQILSPKLDLQKKWLRVNKRICKLSFDLCVCVDPEKERELLELKTQRFNIEYQLQQIQLEEAEENARYAFQDWCDNRAKIGLHQ